MLYISSAIIVSLFALGNLNPIAKLYLVCSVIFIFTSYYCSYIEEIRFTVKNSRDLTKQIDILSCYINEECLEERKIDDQHKEKDSNQKIDWLSLLMIKAVS